ncbi:DUF2905 domain-containing protein [Psychrobacter sanguinis]|nr:DUF2905 domain-containing protein [Psychrobacter sanguinis]
MSAVFNTVSNILLFIINARYGEMGKVFITIGLIIVIIGIVLTLFPNALSWFGKLPGDIRYESGNTRIYFPIVTMIVVSVVLSLLLSIFRR